MLRTSRLIPPKKEDGSARPIVGELRRFTGCYGLILSATSNWADGRPRLEPHPFEAHGRKLWVTLARPCPRCGCEKHQICRAYGLANANESTRKSSDAIKKKKGLGNPENDTTRKPRKRVQNEKKQSTTRNK